MLECEEALKGADYAFYLVHSMLPSARFTQGVFQDLDLIIADNFARAASKAGIKQIIYLGGLIPDDRKLSRHLKSRLEVEQTLGSRTTPVTALRAGIVIGPDGSSYQILRNLVRKMPLIVCPRWIKSLTQPIALCDLLELFSYCLEHPSPENRSFDIGAPEALSYRELLERTAEQLGIRRKIQTIPWPTSICWKRLLAIATDSPIALVAPLVESMKHSMVARDRQLQLAAGIPGISVGEAISKALFEECKRGRRKSKCAFALSSGDVRSVQRMPLPPGKSALWVALEYMSWLPVFFHIFLRAKVDASHNLKIKLRFLRLTLLELSYATDRSSQSDRQLFYVVGGILARKPSGTANRARLEFREALGSTCVLAAIHDYRPTLPMPLYNITQAVLHAWVMKSFSRHLATAHSSCYDCAKMSNVSTLLPPKFVLDVHLGKLARHLRMVGLDSLWKDDYNDDELLEISTNENRVLLTRDRALHDRAKEGLRHYVQALDPELQLLEVLDRFNLQDRVRAGKGFLSRCLECNSAIIPVRPDQLEERLPAHVRSRYQEFFLCPRCERIYWKGSHFDRMRERVHRLLSIK